MDFNGPFFAWERLLIIRCAVSSPGYGPHREEARRCTQAGWQGRVTFQATMRNVSGRMNFWSDKGVGR